MKEDRNIEIEDGIVDQLRPWILPESRVREGVSQFLNAIRDSLDYDAERQRSPAHAERLEAALCKVEKLLDSAPIVLHTAFHPSSFNLFRKEAKRFRETCQRIVVRGPRHHANYSVAKELSAHAARELLEDFSKAKIASSPVSAFRSIAGLIHEVITGVCGADLKKACDRELKQDRRPLVITVRV
jgi:hypothetical protein